MKRVRGARALMGVELVKREEKEGRRELMLMKEGKVKGVKAMEGKGTPSSRSEDALREFCFCWRALRYSPRRRGCHPSK